MSSVAPKFGTTLSLVEMEALIRRVVKEAVHEELTSILRLSPDSLLEDWSHEGPADPEGDRVLLAEALTQREQYRTDRQEWMDLDVFKAELTAAEAAGELPD